MGDSFLPSSHILIKTDADVTKLLRAYMRQHATSIEGLDKSRVAVFDMTKNPGEELPTGLTTKIGKFTKPHAVRVVIWNNMRASAEPSRCVPPSSSLTCASLTCTSFSYSNTSLFPPCIECRLRKYEPEPDPMTYSAQWLHKEYQIETADELIEFSEDGEEVETGTEYLQWLKTLMAEPTVEVKAEPPVEVKAEPPVEVESEPPVEVESEPPVGGYSQDLIVLVESLKSLVLSLQEDVEMLKMSVNHDSEKIDRLFSIEKRRFKLGKLGVHE
jgi:hypothetical protein